jgi:Ca-activated chloride channel family protein
MAEPPQAVASDAIPPREYVFVIDVSGSMYGFPLDTAKKLMSDLSGVLRPSDTFNVIVFADGTETFSPVSVPATRANLSRALQFIGRKDGRGGTRLLAALQRAAALPRQTTVSRSIVLLTDGYIDSEPEVFDFIRDQLNRTNFFAFGIGPSVNRFLIEGVARAGLGEPFIVTEPGEAEQAATRLRRYIESPVLSGIDVKFAGLDVSTWSRKRSDLFASRPIVVSANGAGRSAVRSRFRGSDVVRIRRHSRGSGRRERGASCCGICGRGRVANLDDFGRERQIRTGLELSVVISSMACSRATSFIAVMRSCGATDGAEDVDQPLVAGRSDRAGHDERCRAGSPVGGGHRADAVRVCPSDALEAASTRVINEDEAVRADGRGARRLGMKRHYAERSIPLVDPAADGGAVEVVSAPRSCAPAEGCASHERFVIEKACADQP